MEAIQVISTIADGQRDPHWIIFPYHKLRFFLILLSKLFFVIVVLGMSLTLVLWSPKPLSQDIKTIAYPLLGVGSIGLLVFFHHIYTLLFLKKNMIVLTEHDVIKSIRGKIKSYPFEKIQNLKLIRIPGRASLPEHYIEFTDTRDNHIIELARNREFGRADEIYSVLKTKIQ